VTGRSPVRRALLGVIGFYSRAVSPALPPRCRFAPTCSAYAAEAIERHGAARGTWLALRRLAKCAPWHPGGWDPVPGTDVAHRASSTAGTPASGAPHPEPSDPPSPPRAVQEESSVV
jgi:hypothetical protein